MVLARRLRRRFRRRLKRKMRRYRKGNFGALSNSTTQTGFPKKILMKHKYSYTFGMTGTTGAIASLFISTNGMYQPSNSGATEQPLYFDQMTSIYDHYCVIGSRAKFKILPDSSGSFTKPVVAGLIINDDTTLTYTQARQLADHPTGKIQYLNINMNKPAVLTQSWSAKKYFNKNPLADTDLQGTSAANPNEQSWYNLVLQDVTQAVTFTADVIVEVEYIAIWKELKDIASS